MLLCVVVAMAEPEVRVVSTGSPDKAFATDNVRKLVLSATAVDVMSPAGSVLLSVPVANISRVELTHGESHEPQIAPDAKIELCIVPMSGEEQQYAFSLIGLITFDEENIYLLDHKGEVLGQQTMASVRKIVFRETEQQTPTSLSQPVTHIRAYPVPAQDMLIVEGVESGSKVRVYSMQGALMTEVAVSEGQTQVPVAALPQGDYLLQAGVEIIKFIKK